MGQENSNDQFNYERYTALAKKEQTNGKSSVTSIQKKHYVIEKLNYPLKLSNLDKNMQKISPIKKQPQISNIPKIMKKKPNFTKILKLNLDNDVLIKNTLNEMLYKIKKTRKIKVFIGIKFNILIFKIFF